MGNTAALEICSIVSDALSTDIMYYFSGLFFFKESPLLKNSTSPVILELSSLIKKLSLILSLTYFLSLNKRVY